MKYNINSEQQTQSTNCDLVCFQLPLADTNKSNTQRLVSHNFFFDTTAWKLGSHRKSKLDTIKEMLRPLWDWGLLSSLQVNVIEEGDWCLFTACLKAVEETTGEESNKEERCPAERSFPESASLFSRERKHNASTLWAPESCIYNLLRGQKWHLLGLSVQNSLYYSKNWDSVFKFNNSSILNTSIMMGSSPAAKLQIPTPVCAGPCARPRIRLSARSFSIRYSRSVIPGDMSSVNAFKVLSGLSPSLFPFFFSFSCLRYPRTIF